MKLLVGTGLPIGWTEGVVAADDKIGVEDLGMKTGALTDCAGRLGAASVVGGDCGGRLSDEKGQNDGKIYKFRGSTCGRWEGRA